MILEIYTETEKEFVTKLCSLMNLKLKTKEIKSTISHTEMIVEINDNDTKEVFKQMLSWHYHKVLGLN